MQGASVVADALLPSSWGSPYTEQASNVIPDVAEPSPDAGASGIYYRFTTT